ncbi:MAG: hypothetical protein AMXMBFR7_11330 [Planctomycetota bacterium]
MSEQAAALTVPLTNRSLRAKRAGFDIGMLRWAVSLALVFTAANLFILTPWLQIVGSAANVAVAAGLGMYFGHLLFRRLQCSLAEWLVIVIALGSAFGIMVATPGVGIVWEVSIWLAPLIVAWIFYGAVLGLVHAELLGRTSMLARSTLIAAGWITTVSPACMALALAIHLGSNWPGFVGGRLLDWSVPLGLFGALGMIGGYALRRRVVRAAREILAAR